MRTVMRASTVIVVMVVAAVGAQDERVALPFRWHSGWSNNEMLAASSVVLVGKVQSIGFVGSVIEAADENGAAGTWQLVKASVTIENQLKGSVPGRVAHFYFYTTSGPIMGDTNNLKVGSRHVFFLVFDSGVLRAVRDLWRSGIEVGTGSHVVAMEAGQSLQETVATLLLTAGAELNPKTFERVIIRSVPFAEEWLDHCRVMRLLDALAHYPNEEVQKAVRHQEAIREPCGFAG